MYTIKGIIIVISLVYITKALVYIIDKLLKFKDEKIQFNMDVKKESIMNMTGIEFEAFCRWLFEGTGEYRYVEITEARGDGGKDLILIDKNEKKTYVECKRFDSEEKLEKIENKSDIKKLVIGREICQKLVGAMVSNNIDKGIIVTTGEVHKNALNYIEDLKNNSSIDLQIYNMKDILEIMESNKARGVYEIDVII